MRFPFKALTLLATVTLLSACVSNSGSQATSIQPEFKPMAVTSSMNRAIRADIRKQLKDPSSARFGEVRGIQFTAVEDKILYGDVYSRRKGETIRTVCGKLNAKNSYGGYTGESLYYAESRNGGPWKTYIPGWGCYIGGFGVTAGGQFTD